MEALKIETFESEGGSFLVFLGTWGSEGLLVIRPGSEPRFHPCGSKAWDAHHQGAYRNSRATPVSIEEMERRGVTIPPLEQYRDRPAVEWEANFDAAAGLEEVPPALRSRLEQAEATVYVVMYEDGYESAFGDGTFVYAEAAFWDAASAESHIEGRRSADPETAKWYRFHVKPVRLAADVGHGVLRAELKLERYEHLDVKEVLSLLAS